MLSFSPIAYTTPAEGERREPAARMIATAGNYTLTGAVVTPRAARIISASASSYALTGQSIDFYISFSTTSFLRIVLVGSTSNHIRNFRMATNFVMTAGDSKTLVITVRNADGDAVNITGATIKWQAARSYGKTSVISKTTSSGISITDGTNGVFAVTLSPSDTDSLSGIYHHEAELTATDTTKSTVLVGTMKINPALIEAT